MSLTTRLQNELSQLQPPATLRVPEPQGTLRSDVVAIDTLGVSFNLLRWETSRLAGASIAQLQKLAEDLSKRVNYLLEPIAPVEVDAAGCTVQLRSSPPQKNDDGSTYYELLVKAGGDLTLRRYRKEPQSPRVPIAATVTREVFVRLANDLASSTP